MAIRLGCRCGEQIVTDEANIGQTIRCPTCNLLLRVPQLQPARPPVSEAVQAQPPANPPPPAPAGDYQLPAPPPLPSQHVQAQPPAPRAQYPEPPATEEPILEDEPILEEDYEDEEEREKTRRRKQKMRVVQKQMKYTALGLTLLNWSFLPFILAQLLSLIFAFVPILVLVSLGLVFIHGILFAAGSILCCWVPPKSKARTLIIISVALNGASMGLFLIFFIIIFGVAVSGSATIAQFGGTLALAVVGMALLLLPAAFVFFMLFLRFLAHFLHERSTAEEVTSILVTWLLLLIAYIPNLVILLLLIYFLGCIGILFGFVVSLTWFFYWMKVWIRVLNATSLLRTVIGRDYRV